MQHTIEVRFVDDWTESITVLSMYEDVDEVAAELRGMPGVVAVEVVL